MKINIKNARRLETLINEQIDRQVAKIHQGSQDDVSKTQVVLNTIELVKTCLSKLNQLRCIRETIRQSICLFNVEQGINDITLYIATAESNLKVAVMLAEYDSPRTTRSYNSDIVSYSRGLDEDTKEHYYNETLVIRRRIQKLKDRCQGINASGTIELSDENETCLKSFGLID